MEKKLQDVLKGKNMYFEFFSQNHKPKPIDMHAFRKLFKRKITLSKTRFLFY